MDRKRLENSILPVLPFKIIPVWKVCLHLTLHIYIIKLILNASKKTIGRSELRRIPRSSREILSSFGRRSSSETVVRSLRSYGLYGSTAVFQYGSTVVRSKVKVVRYSIVHFAPTRSTPGGSADIYI